MDQGPLQMPERRGWTRQDVVELAGAVAVQYLVAAVLAVGAALAWSLITDRLFLEALPVTALVTGVALPVLGNVGSMHDAQMGLDAAHAPRQSRAGDDNRLTPVGVMLFVSVPVVVVGQWLGA